MNIFVVDKDPRKAARMLCDKHVVKMTLETTEILSTVMYKMGFDPDGLPYSPKFENYQVCCWPMNSETNMKWLFLHGFTLSLEYSFRYRRNHTCHSMMRTMADTYFDGYPPNDHTLPKPDTFIQAMPDKYKTPGNPVQAYRDYYRAEKNSLLTGTKDDPPRIGGNCNR